MDDRDPKGRFVKGNQVSARINGGTGGRPKGLQERARAATHDGADLIAFYLDVFRDTLTQTVVPAEGEPKVMPVPVKLELRLEAAAWLADRGWGKPMQPTELLGENGQHIVFTVKWGDDQPAIQNPSTAGSRQPPGTL